MKPAKAYVSSLHLSIPLPITHILYYNIHIKTSHVMCQGWPLYRAVEHVNLSILLSRMIIYLRLMHQVLMLPVLLFCSRMMNIPTVSLRYENMCGGVDLLT